MTDVFIDHCAKKPVTTMLTYPWKCTVLHCNHLGNTWKPLVLMTRHFDYCPSASEGDNQSVRSSAPVVSRCFPGGLMTRHFDYCPSASEGDNQSVRSSAPVVSRCFPGGYNVKLYISRGRLTWWLLAFLHSGCSLKFTQVYIVRIYIEYVSQVLSIHYSCVNTLADKVSMLTHTYPYKPLREIKCDHLISPG